MDDGLPRQLTRLSRRLLDHPGRALRDLLRHTGDLLAPPPAPPPRPVPPAAAQARAGAVSEVTAFGSNPGGLRMLLYQPGMPRPGAPLLVLLHGCGQDAANFAAASGFTALADRLGATLLLPDQVTANNQGRCFNWFRPADARRDGGEASSIRQMVAEALRRGGGDPARVFVAGLSAGGAMTAALLLAYPDVFAAGAVVAGLPVGAARDVGSALQRMAKAGDESRAVWVARAAAAGGPPVGSLPRLSVWHGSGDRAVDPANAEALLGQWTGLLKLPETPNADLAPSPGVRRRAWGQAVEAWTIAGLGHGFPIAAAPATDPFVLPSPIQASDAIARFWGVLDG